jgi:hypothetical protein
MFDLSVLYNLRQLHNIFFQYIITFIYRHFLIAQHVRQDNSKIKYSTLFNIGNPKMLYFSYSILCHLAPCYCESGWRSRPNPNFSHC